MECEKCYGTGEVDYGKELWETHKCENCNGTGKVEE